MGPFWDDTGGVPNLTSSSCSHPPSGAAESSPQSASPASPAWAKLRPELEASTAVARLTRRGDRSPTARCDRRRKQTLSRVFRDHSLKGKPARAVWNALGTLRQILTRTGWSRRLGDATL